MKLKLAAAILVLATLSTPAQAGPFGKAKDFVKHHPKFSAAVAALAVGTTVQLKGSNRCSQGYLEVCNEGYGSRQAFVGFTAGAGVGLLFAGNKCSKDQPGWWFCNVLEFGVPAYQTYAGIQDFRHFTPCEYGQAACGKPDTASIFRKR